MMDRLIRKRNYERVALAIGLLCCVGDRPVRASLIPNGSSFVVNATPVYGAEPTSVATDRDGNVLFAWEHDDGSLRGIFAQLYDSTGSPVGGEFQVNSYTLDDQITPSVFGQVIPPYLGGFEVVWSSYGQDGSGWGIYERFVHTDGTFTSSEARVNRTTGGDQFRPAGAFRSSGAPVPLPFFFWGDNRSGDYDIYGNIKTPFGFDLIDHAVSVHPGSDETRPAAAVAPASNGPLVVVWQSSPGDGSSTAVFGLRHDSLGSPLGTEFLVNSYTIGSQGAPDVAVDASGAFVVVWNGSGGGAYNGVFGQRFDSLGARAGSEFQVTMVTLGSPDGEKVVSDPGGGFVVAWSRPRLTYPLSVHFDVLARRFSSTGTPEGGETTIANDAAIPDVAQDSSGGFIVVWDSGVDAVAQRFVDATETATPSPTATASPTATPSPTSTNAGPVTPSVTPTPSSVPDLCPLSTSSGCRTAAKSVLLMKDSTDNGKDKLLWKWIKGQSTTDVELGDPSISRTYSLCVYDAAGRRISAEVPPSASKWQGLKYKDGTGSPDGIQKIVLKSGASSNAKILVKGKGENLPDTPLGSFTLPITVQLINDETSLCFQGVYGVAEVIKNDATQFKAKAQN
jgi:hypothetical protein